MTGIPTLQLRNGPARAEITLLAAAIRSLSVDGTDLTEPVPAGAIAPQGNGLVLAPWPNRVRDGRWTDHGVDRQLDITEPAFGNASHGLLRNTLYRVRDRSDAAVTLGSLIAPQHGWPFLLDTWVRYELRPDGLEVDHVARNLGSGTAPWAVGAHPYLRVGDAAPETLTVTVTGARTIDTDARHNALAVRDVTSDDDIRGGRALGELQLDRAYTDLASGDAAWLTARDGSRTVLRLDPPFGWVQLYTPHDHPRPNGKGLAVAIEPMTAPPDALNSGIGLAWIEPGAEWRASWSLRREPA